MMHHHHHGGDVADPSPQANLSAGESDGKCPMDCCTPGHRQNEASPVTATIPSPLALRDQSINSVAVTFLSAGLSSHTDRGPPSA